MKRYGYPLFVIIVGSLITYLFDNYVFILFKEEITLILRAILLFVFGTYLSTYSSKKNGWIKKLVVFTLAVCLLFVQMDVAKLPIITTLLNEIGANSLIFSMLYIYLGYIFF